MGSRDRKKFGVTGDTVNTGARVESLNKDFSTSILITRETLDKLAGAFNVRRCGEVKVKGREKEVEVFEVLIPGTSESVPMGECHEEVPYHDPDSTPTTGG